MRMYYLATLLPFPVLPQSPIFRCGSVMPLYEPKSIHDEAR